MRTEDQAQIIYAVNELENADIRLRKLCDKWTDLYRINQDETFAVNITAVNDVILGMSSVFSSLEEIENGKYFASTLEKVHLYGGLEVDQKEAMTGHYIKQEIVRKCIGMFPNTSEQYFWGFLAGLCAVSTNRNETMRDFIELSYQEYGRKHAGE